jgi:hypothetical protein
MMRPNILYRISLLKGVVVGVGDVKNEVGWMKIFGSLEGEVGSVKEATGFC